MNKLKTLFDNTKSLGKSFEVFIQFLIILSIVTFSIETLPDLPILVIKILNIIEIGCVTIFTIELIGRIIFSKKGLNTFTVYE